MTGGSGPIYILIDTQSSSNMGAFAKPALNGPKSRLTDKVQPLERKRKARPWPLDDNPDGRRGVWRMRGTNGRSVQFISLLIVQL